MRLKKFEDYSIVNSSELGDNWSPEYHINKAKGKTPYIKKKEIFIEVETKTIPKDAIYLTPEDADRLNYIGEQINKLKEQQKNILMGESLTSGDY